MKNYKNDFPIFGQTIHGKPLIFLDSAASAQKPQCVIDTIKNFYSNDYANIHRGVYELSERATHLYEGARHTIQEFIHAKSSREIIFVRGATEGINLVAESYGRTHLKANDEILVSNMEHHSNIVPWQMLADKYDLKIKMIPITDAGEIDLDAYQQLFTERTKLVAIAHASNVLGTINPIKQMTAIAHAHQAVVMVDGAQAVPHLSVDVQDLNCDFYVFSSHKAYGPTGLGVLYGKEALLEKMPPYQGGGDMIEQVSFTKPTTFNHLPFKFEAGTPHIAGVIGFKAALDYLSAIGMNNIMEKEKKLLAYANDALKTIPGLRLIGTASHKLAVTAFVLEDIHPHDLGTILDHEGVAIRAGHHCAMPLMERFNIPACARASFGLYNTTDDVDALITSLHIAKRLFA